MNAKDMETLLDYKIKNRQFMSESYLSENLDNQDVMRTAEDVASKLTPEEKKLFKNPDFILLVYLRGRGLDLTKKQYESLLKNKDYKKARDNIKRAMGKYYKLSESEEEEILTEANTESLLAKSGEIMSRFGRKIWRLIKHPGTLVFLALLAAGLAMSGGGGASILGVLQKAYALGSTFNTAYNTADNIKRSQMLM